MKVILTERVRTLGNVGEIVNVSAGYARNFLFPQNVAVLADASNKNVLANQQRALAKKVAAQKADAEAIKSKVQGLTIELIKKVGANGRLFGTVTSTELSKELANRDIDVEKRQIQILDPIKSTGTFEVVAKLFTEVEAQFKVKVDMDPAQAEELKKQEAAAAAAKKKKAEKREESKAAEGAEDTESTEEETTEA